MTVEAAQGLRRLPSLRRTAVRTLALGAALGLALSIWVSAPVFGGFARPWYSALIALGVTLAVSVSMTVSLSAALTVHRIRSRWRGLVDEHQRACPRCFFPCRASEGACPECGCSLEADALLVEIAGMRSFDRIDRWFISYLWWLFLNVGFSVFAWALLLVFPGGTTTTAMFTGSWIGVALVSSTAIYGCYFFLRHRRLAIDLLVGTR